MRLILLVDDDEDYLRQFRNFLLREGFTVECAVNAEEALTTLQDSNIRLLITDLNMPGIDGIELARRTKKIRPHLPVILSTGIISPRIQRIAENAGIKAVLYKPFDVQRMLAMVRDELDRQRV